MMRIPGRLLEKIFDHVRSSYPEEGCGVLIGKVDGEERSVVKVRSTRNTHPDRRNRYTIDPVTIFHAERGAESEGLELIGVFHSHPDRPVEPSGHDRDGAWGSLTFMIIAVSKGVVGEARAWRSSGDERGFVEEPIRVD